MGAQGEVFLPKHRVLLRIAVWANFFAWAALIVALFLPLAKYVEIQNIYQESLFMSGQIPDFAERLRTNPLYAGSVLVDTLNSFLDGFIYFLLLRGLSLGLNMIVETDVNYREAGRQEGAR